MTKLHGLNYLSSTQNPRVLFVVDAPLKETPDVAIRKDHLTFLAAKLKNAGFTKDDIGFLSCATPIDIGVVSSEKQVGEFLKENRPALVSAIKTLRPEIIVPMGKNPARQVFGRAVKIMEARGSVVGNEEFSAKVLPIFGVAHVLRSPHYTDLFTADIATLRAVFDGGGIAERRSVDYRWCKDIGFLLENPPELVAVDTETTGLRWYDRNVQVLTVQLTWEEGSAVVIPILYNHETLPEEFRQPMPGKIPVGRKVPENHVKDHVTSLPVVKQLKKLLEDPRVRVVGMNLKFDYLMLKEKLGIYIANFDHDVQAIAHELDENVIRPSLDDLVKIYVPSFAGYNDSLNNDPEHQAKSRMDLFSADKMLRYAGGDTDATLRLFNVICPKLQEDKEAYNHYRRVVMPGLRGFCVVESNGFPVSVDKLEEFNTYLKEWLGEEHKRLIEQIPQSIRTKFASTGVGLKISRADLLIDFLFQHPDGLRLKPLIMTPSKKPSVSTKDHLPFFTDDHPIIRDIITYIQMEKMQGTFVEGFKKYIVKGKVRSSFSLTTTVTGRTSASDPNSQNWPKRGKLAKKYRNIFVAPPGYCFIESDLSQAELRIVAHMANERVMMSVYRSGGDIHTKTAKSIMRVSDAKWDLLSKDEKKSSRTSAKACNFGFVYGMWWKKFKEYAKANYGVDYNDKQSKEYREIFFTVYPDLEPWHERQRAFVNEHGYVRALHGRIRHLPQIYSSEESVRKEAERQSINAPVQVLASDIGVVALSRVTQEVPNDRLSVLGFIHDALISMVRVEDAAWAARTVKSYMQGCPFKEWFGFEMKVPIIADVSIGTTLADMTEIPEDVVLDERRITYEDLIEGAKGNPPVSKPKPLFSIRKRRK